VRDDPEHIEIVRARIALPVPRPTAGWKNAGVLLEVFETDVYTRTDGSDERG